MNNDMPNWRRFVEEITGQSYYESPNREPPKKNTKTTADGREGVEPNQRKQEQDNV